MDNKIQRLGYVVHYQRGRVFGIERDDYPVVVEVEAAGETLDDLEARLELAASVQSDIAEWNRKRKEPPTKASRKKSGE